MVFEKYFKKSIHLHAKKQKQNLIKMKYSLLCIFLLTGIMGLKAQKEVGGVELPSTLQVDGQSLKLNGAGIREKWFLDIYVGSLYLTNKTPNADKVIQANEAMAIRIDMVSGLITSEKMETATREGFEKSTNGNQSKYTSEIDAFINVFTKEEIAEGDRYDIIYNPKTGTQVKKNGKLAATIEGYEFKKALWGIWFCDDPADEDLKEGMLGIDY